MAKTNDLKINMSLNIDKFVSQLDNISNLLGSISEAIDDFKKTVKDSVEDGK